MKKQTFTRDQLLTIKTALHLEIDRNREHAAQRTNPYTATLCTSIVASMIACNQSLSILLTNQLCDGLEEDKEKFALDLENTAVVVAPLVPWSIAGGVPLAAVGAPTASILFTCFLYLLPLWRLVVENFGKKNKTAK